MTGMVRRLKVNRRYAGAGCAWCGDAMALGEEGAVCEACEAVHHARCWDEHNGCGNTGCVNAPLLQDPTTTVWEELPPRGEMRCPHCRKLLPVGTLVCSGCQRYTTPSGIYEGERKLAEDARNAFLLGLVALLVPPILNVFFYTGNFRTGSWIPLVIGLRCGWAAVKKGGEAKTKIANDQTLKGRGLSTAAQVLGGISLGLPILSLLVLIFVFVSR